MTADSLAFCGHRVSSKQIQLICEVVAGYQKLSRLELAKTVCELLQWYRPNGQLKANECRLFLERMHEQSLIQLPELRSRRPKGSITAIPQTVQGTSRHLVHGSLNTFQPIYLHRVTTAEDRALWKELIDRHHYLGHRVPFGAYIRYFIQSSVATPVILGCLQFSSPAWRMKDRDRWIGWDDSSRKLSLQRIINNSRFLILPWVNIPNLASHILSKAVRTVVKDWEQLYAVRPCLVETLVDIKRYSGSCYRAANWIEVGITSGRGRQDQYHQRHGQSPKRIFLRPIHPKARKILCQQTSR